MPQRNVRAQGGRAAANGQSDSDELEGTTVASVSVQRASARRAAAARVDFSKLETNSLRKYRKFHQIEVPANSTKEELIPVISRHFANQTVDEEDALINFVLALKRYSINARPAAAQPGVKKQRYSGKPKAR